MMTRKEMEEALRRVTNQLSRMSLAMEMLSNRLTELGASVPHWTELAHRDWREDGQGTDSQGT